MAREHNRFRAPRSAESDPKILSGSGNPHVSSRFYAFNFRSLRLYADCFGVATAFS